MPFYQAGYALSLAIYALHPSKETNQVSPLVRNFIHDNNLKTYDYVNKIALKTGFDGKTSSKNIHKTSNTI